MIERIKQLLDLTLHGKMYVQSNPTKYDREDLFLPDKERDVKRLCQYILNQEPLITPYSCMTGFFRFDDTVIGDAFTRIGHTNTKAAMDSFYLKPLHGISTMEWQHATADYQRVLHGGLTGILADIQESKSIHSSASEHAFLTGLEQVARALILWAEKCSARAAQAAAKMNIPEYQNNLWLLAETLKRVPKYAPQNFYEAVLTIYICYSLDPDSVGTLDRYLSVFYCADLKKGILTRDMAMAYLQELYLMLQAKTATSEPAFTRGGESHFCVGGYLPSGEDCFNETSRLIIDSLIDLPVYCPQITLRWTKKLSHDDFRYVMDCERKDPFKRFAFTNDEKRLKCYTEICHIPFERAVNYTMVGCNEPAFLGAITGSTSKGNIAHCVDVLFHEKSYLIENVKSFEDFYAIFEQEMISDLDIIYAYDDKYNMLRAKDTNYVSSLVFHDCIENAVSMTQGGGNTVIASPMLIGITNVIDSLIVVRQFVFEEKRITMHELIDAVQQNWNGHEMIRTLLLRRGHFFGNDDDLSNAIAQRLYLSFYRYLKNKTNIFGYHFLVGDLMGYNEHHKWFGASTKATPDGRHDGDLLKFCIGQSEGRDRNGLTALLNSVAKLDPHGIACGCTVTNVSLDKGLIDNDANFEKTVDIFETYFQNGGVHFQLTYVSHEELVAAQKDPGKYQNLRVRVTGYSDYFVRLNESLQTDIIRRTMQDVVHS